MKYPRITVATVCFNSANILEESVISVINQTYTDVEYIIIDGGSTDGTLDLLAKYNKKIDILVSESDNGIYDAMNKALKYATGDFIIFLGADDHFLSWRTLEKVAPKLTDQKHVFYGQVYFEAYNLLHKGKFNRFKRAKFNYCHQAIFYPKSVYKQYQYDCQYKLFADNEYNFRVSETHTFVWINETVAFYADGGKSSLRTDDEWDKIEKKQIVEHCGRLPWWYCKLWRIYKKVFH